MNIAVISPHRDDVAFSLSLSIRAWLERGHVVHVVCCFTRSSYAPFWKGAAPADKERLPIITATRAAEDELWIRNFSKGITLIDLHQDDAPLRLGCTEDEVCAIEPSPFDPAIQAIAEYVDSHQFDAVVLPLALGAHVDHLTARDALIELNNKSIPLAFYEDLPYAARPGAAQKIESLVQQLPLSLSPGFIESSSSPAQAVAFKTSCIAAYVTQIAPGTAHQIAAFCKRYSGRERLWATAIWQESKLDWIEESMAGNRK